MIKHPREAPRPDLCSFEDCEQAAVVYSPAVEAWVCSAHSTAGSWSGPGGLDDPTPAEDKPRYSAREIQAARLEGARAIWRWCYEEVQYEHNHIAGPDTSYGYGVRGVTAALLGKFGLLSTDEAMAKIIGESVGGDAIAGRLDSEAAAVHVSVGDEVSGIDEAGESIGQSSGPATPSADATPPAQAAEPPRPYFIEASGSTFVPGAMASVCVLCGETMMVGTGWARYKSKAYAHSACAFANIAD
jgi:hypothetical protein